ncbi:MAG TPA: cytidine deaminase [Kofleriaceae bacterium]|nr:cytidine deaminase [Kofleriaceae bacterium]
MTADDRELVTRALEARERAYAPYSGYQVGCAVLADGRVYQGANVENASYGLALCAERSAVAAAVMGGARRIQTAAVATVSSPPAAPCGMCLQTLSELAEDPASLRILLVNPAGERRELTLAECLPHGFRRDQLPG